MHEISSEPRQSIVLTLSPTIVEGDVLTLDKACLIETLADYCNERSWPNCPSQFIRTCCAMAAVSS